MSTPHPSPVFIVGSPRSGTSLLVVALRNAAYFGFNEGNFFALLEQIYLVTDRHYAAFGADTPYCLMAHLDKQALKASIAELFKQIVERANSAAPWFDKSGNAAMIRQIPLLVQLWPEAHFIFAKRRGIENVASRLKKFPEITFENHCKGWANTMSAWRAVRAELPDLKCVEIEQQELILDPRGNQRAPRRISQFLRRAEGRARGHLPRAAPGADGRRHLAARALAANDGLVAPADRIVRAALRGGDGQLRLHA